MVAISLLLGALLLGAPQEGGWQVQAGALEHSADAGRSLYSGGVQWRWAGMRGDADSMSVEWDGSRARAIAASGAPLRLRQDGGRAQLVMRAARMDYDPRAGMLRMSGGVEVRQGDVHLQGRTLEYSLDGGRLHLHGGVQARRGDAMLAGGSLEYDTASGQIEVEGEL